MAKTFIIAVIAFVAGGTLSYWLTGGTDTGAGGRQKREPLYWVAPMDAGYRRDAPGKSPMGMDLIPVYEQGTGDDIPGTVTISPNVENNLGVKIDQAVATDLALKIKTVGFIQFNEKTVHHFHSRVEGWIEELSVTSVGDPVTPGQKLFELYAPELLNAQEEYLAALTAGNLSLVNASVRKLELLGVEKRQIETLRRSGKVSQRLPFYAQKAGYVASLNVREGSFIRPANNVISVGALDTVWVIGEIFERQAGWVQPGQRVQMSTDSYPGRRWLGSVDYLYPVLDEQTRTLRARIVFDNTDQRLKPNMFTQLEIDAGLQQSVVVVPRQAVIRTAGASRVVKALGDGKFLSVPIRTGIVSGSRVVVAEGLEAGEEVVVSGQFMIDSESSLAADLLRIGGGSVNDSRQQGE